MSRVLAVTALLLSSIPGFAAGPMSIGDRGSISVPLFNNPASTAPVDGAAISAVVSVASLDILETSFLGPVSVFPGCTTYFRIDFEIGEGYDLSSGSATITIDLTHTSPDFLPSARKWVYRTQNLFRSMRGECLEPDGVFCGEYLSPDVDPPFTMLLLDGPEYADEEDRIYIATHTFLDFISGDSYLVDSEISGSSVAAYQLNTPPLTFGDMTPAVAPFTLPEGIHLIYFASRDYAGNAEVIKSTTVTVDGTAPLVTLLIAGSTVPDGGEVYLVEGDSITLEGVDPVSNGVASGLLDIYYLTGAAWDECPEGEPTFTGPPGTCENPRYEGPFTLTPGTHTVYYLAHDMVMNASAVRTAHFTVGSSSGAAEASITPSSGPIGLPFTITGEGFGAYSAGTTVALIGGATAPLTLWTDTQIKGTVPGSLAAGEYPVLVMRGAGLLAETSSFTVVVPALAEISPSSGPIGLPFTLTGSGFGNYVANYTRALIGGTTCQLTLWTDTQIKGTIPGTITPGVHEVLVERALNGGLVRSATVMFDLRNMEADWIAPSSGPIGMPFTIAGSGFGNYVANYTTVLMGGATCPLTLWTDGRINGIIPAELGVGTHTVIAARGQYLSDPLELYVPEGGGYSPSSFMAPLSPSAAFRLGEVYVYPNPAKGGAVPVFHLEFGLADKVELKVYSVAGTLVHERTLTGPPQVTSPAYAYEYAWEGHIASGVYYFTVEAERAGSKLKSRGKFAVVR